MAVADKRHKIQPERLVHRITIQTVTETRDDVGQAVESWSTLASVWGEAVPNRGQERFVSAQRFAEADFEFRIRHRTDVTPKHRVSYAGDVYDIMHVYEPEWAVRGSMTVIVAKRRNV